MRICIDSSAFIPALQGSDPAASRVLDLVSPTLELVVPRLIAQEGTRNLGTTEQVRRFYQLFHERSFALIIDKLVPPELVNKYVQLGLREKADAFIGAFAAWQQVRYLVSEHRHFLRELQATAFAVVDAAEFVTHWQKNRL